MLCSVCRAENRTEATLCVTCGTWLVGSLDERKIISVLFADVRGSLGLIRGRDPEEARDILGPAVELMINAVRAQGGTVARTMGDGIMAFFGAPITQEDHAARACHAALAIRDAAVALGGRIRRERGIGFSVRVGVHSGEVLFGSTEASAFREFAVDGETVHLAARMEQTARPNTARASGVTIRLAEGTVLAKSLGAVRIRGLDVPIPVFELSAALAHRSRLIVASERRRLTPFVGREAELTALEGAMRCVVQGSGQVVGLSGDPGCGKSRLLHELAARARAAGFGVLCANCVPEGTKIGYLPIRSLCRELFGLLDEHAGLVLRARIEEHLRDRASLDGADGLAAVQSFAALLDAGVTADPSWLDFDPEVRRERTMEALWAVLGAESRERPLMLVIEDLHWADPETLALLDRLAPQLACLRVLLAVNGRPEQSFRWSRSAHCKEIHLAPLQNEEARQFTDTLLGPGAAMSALADLLTARAGGNPFFAEEIVETLTEEGVLVGGRGEYRLAGTVHRLGVPLTVRAVLASRMDRLPTAEKRLLEAAAVLGKDFSEPVLTDLLGAERPAIQELLRRLEAACFVRWDEPSETHRHSFHHGLTHEVAYVGMPLSRRRAMHSQALDTMERLYTERRADHAEGLARHAAEARRWDRVAMYARLAGQKAVMRSANVQAVAFFEEALAAVSELPEDLASTRLGIDIRMELRYPLFRLGRITRVLELLQEAKPLAERLEDHLPVGQLAIFLGHALWLSGDTVGAEAVAERASAMAGAADDRALRVRARFQLGLTAYAFGDFAAAEAVMFEVSAAIRGEAGLRGRYGLDAAVDSVALSYAARALAERGELAAAAKAAEESARLAAEWNRPFSHIFSEVALGHVALLRGDWDAALPHSERALEFCRTAEGTLMAPVALALQGAVRLRAGLPPEMATEALEEATRLAEEMGFLFGQPQRLALLAEARLRLGQVEEATRDATRARELSERLGDRAGVAQTERAAAVVAATCGDLEAPQRHLRRAAAEAEALGMRPLAVLCRVELAELLTAAGQLRAALVEVTAAIAACPEECAALAARARRARGFLQITPSQLKGEPLQLG